MDKISKENSVATKLLLLGVTRGKKMEDPMKIGQVASRMGFQASEPMLPKIWHFLVVSLILTITKSLMMKNPFFYKNFWE